VSSNYRSEVRMAIPHSKPQHKEVAKSTYQRHCMIGSKAYALNNEDRIGLYLLSNILGGPGQNSRLNLALRERNGLAYNVEASYTPYSDTGVFSVYFGTDKAQFERALSLVYAEMKRLRDIPLGVQQLVKAKKQLIGQLAIAAENSEALMLNTARAYMFFREIDLLDNVSQKIESITANDLIRIANDIFDPHKLSTLIYK
ncbi:MAG TPA: insulinase family protein, partial [Tenuifilaceae bacterium]|nr:insulinase family protein [Tenuifilaceae bacterium]